MATVLALKDVLLDSAKEIFESMIFMTVAEVEDATPGDANAMLLATITFTGSLEGGLSLCCPLTSAQAVAASMLCMDSPDGLGDDDVIDAIGEVANLLVGAVKTRVQDDIPDISISIPSVVQGRQLSSRLSDGTEKIEVNVTLAEAHRATFSLLYREGGVVSGDGG
ncbi:MAG: chemotaxis protein CheX [Phycisphaerales bacterium]|nr:MAG: chemotaxis protein CheX [Phycisphaerales bacterium]